MGCGASELGLSTLSLSDGYQTLEEKIRSYLTIPEEDKKEALSLARQYPRFKNEFNKLVHLMHARTTCSDGEFIRQAKKITRTKRIVNHKVTQILVDFFALIGGAKASASLYTSCLRRMGVSYLSGNYDSTEFTLMSDEMFVIRSIRHFWWNATHCSREMVGRLAETNVIACMTKDLKGLGGRFHSSSGLFNSSMAIVHNCAKNGMKREIFRQEGLVPLLKGYLKRQEKDIKIISLLTLSYIIEEKENDLLTADPSDFKSLLREIANAWSDASHHSATQGLTSTTSYSLEELLQGLGSLTKNDYNKRLLMVIGVLKLLKPILHSGQEIEQQEAAKIVWSMAFDKQNRTEMKKDEELMDRLERLKGSDFMEVAKAAAGALWVLNMDKRVQEGQSGQGHTNMQGGSAVPPAPSQPGKARPPSAPANPPGKVLPPPSNPPAKAQSPSPPSNPPEEAPPPFPPSNPPGTAPPPPQAPQGPSPAGGGQRGHLMISYQWDNQKTLMQVRDRLVSRGFQVWMDVDNMSGSTLQAMAEAVEQAEAVLMCMSPRYKDSDNCRTEAEYAFKLKKTIIPLQMETNYQPDGWLGILLGTKLFIDFSGKYPFEKKAEALVKEVAHRRQGGDSEVDGPIAAEKAHPVASAPKSGVSSWTEKDVHDWLKKHELSGFPHLLSLTPEKIKFLQHLSQTAPEFFYASVKHDLEVTALADVMRFNNAIADLP
ncbi:hypothetical protein ACOMHN_018752 [Nucella lapillus]